MTRPRHIQHDNQKEPLRLQGYWWNLVKKSMVLIKIENMGGSDMLGTYRYVNGDEYTHLLSDFEKIAERDAHPHLFEEATHV